MVLFRNRLRALREDRDITSEEIAIELYITTCALNNYENKMKNALSL